MSHPASEPLPDPEQVAAYVDGELSPEECRRFKVWLAHHPQAAAEIEAQRTLSRRNHNLWARVAPPRPSEAAWDAVLARIESDLASPPPTLPHRPWRWVTAAAVAAAAAVLPALQPPPLTAPPHRPVSREVAEVFPVAQAADVEIISLRDADTLLLPVGELPVTEPLVLASAGDVIVHDSEAAPLEGGASPMFWPGTGDR